MIKVLIVDDSALIRQVLTRIIDRTGDMKVVGVAGDPYVARELIRETNPDVLTLDVEMPRMDGLAFLEKIMQLRPMPVVMVSTLTDAGSDVAVRALEIGAVDVIAKPKLDIERSLEAYAGVLVSKLRAAAHTRPRRTALLPEPTRSAGVILERKAQALPRSTEKIVAIGASTGGTEAIRIVLSQLPADAPAVLIVQHMPESFTKAFAKRLNEQCALSVKEAEDGERLLVGHAYVAPGHSHLLLGRNGANYIAQLDRGEPVNRHRPSVDVLFRSVANEAGPNAYGVILTGMGADGAQGMKEMHDAGAWTVAQDEASCVVYGMPKEALLAGGVDATVALPDIATQLMGRVGMTLHRTRG